MVEIFKTNVNNHLAAQQIIDLFKTVYTEADVSFDLDDCDHIFRINLAEELVNLEKVVNDLFTSVGFFASALDDEHITTSQQGLILPIQNKSGINVFLGFI